MRSNPIEPNYTTSTRKQYYNGYQPQKERIIPKAAITTAMPYKERIITDISFMTAEGEDKAYALQNPDATQAELPKYIESIDGARTIVIPDFDSMTKFMMSREGGNKRKILYDYLNDQLRRGRLSGIVGFPVLNRSITGKMCNFADFKYWELNRHEILIDITVELKLQTRYGEQDWKGVLVCIGGFSHKFYMTVEELVSDTSYERVGYTPLDAFLVQVYNGRQIDAETEMMWIRYKLKEALKDPSKRKARKLAEAMGLSVLRLPIYEHKGLNSILFFEGGERLLLVLTESKMMRTVTKSFSRMTTVSL